MTLIATVAALLATDPAPNPPQLHLYDHTRYISHIRVCGHRCKQHKAVRPYRAWIARTAACESGGRWHIATGNGFYGGLQFTLPSWRAVGGRGMPHHASRLEQEFRAVRLLHIQGAGAWPVCGR